MTDAQQPPPESIQDGLKRAVRDLWSMVHDSGDDYVVFADRRGRAARVQRLAQGEYGVSWEMDGEVWVDQDRTFGNLREAAFHAYQGPH